MLKTAIKFSNTKESTEMEEISDLELLCPKPASGPLDEFRAKTGFDWRNLRVLIHGEELLRMKMKVWKAMEMEPIFSHHMDSSTLGIYLLWHF